MNRTEILRILMPERAKQIGLAWSIVRQAHLSEDAYQDMLARVLENKDIFEGPKHLRDWSWKVLRNRCYELIRQRKYQVRLLDESILNLVDAELECRDTSDMALRVDALHSCLDGLSEKSRNNQATLLYRFTRESGGGKARQQTGDCVQGFANCGFANVFKRSWLAVEIRSHE